MSVMGFERRGPGGYAVGLGQSLLDLRPCQYGYSKVICRGPAVDPSDPYLAFIGANETVGQFLPRPYASLLSDATGLGCANLGVKNAGPDVFLNEPELLRVASEAEAVVIDLMGATNLSNAFYKVHPRRNDRFIRAFGPLADRAAPPKEMRHGHRAERAAGNTRHIDLTDVHFTGHLLREVERAAPDLLEAIHEELRVTWVERVSQLIASIEAPVHLLCHTDMKGNPARAALVDMAMVDAVARHADTLTCVKATRAARANGTSEMFFNPLEAHVAGQMLSQASHRDAASALAATLGYDTKRARAV